MVSFITFFSQWTEHTARPRITGQNTDHYIPLCCSPSPTSAEEMFPFPTETISMGFIFRSNAARVPLPVTPVSVHSSYTHFRNTNRYLDGTTALGTRMQEQFPYTWDYHYHSLEHEMWPFWGKKPSWEKCFHLPVEKRDFSLENLSLLHVDHHYECQELGLAFKRNCSIHVMQSSRNA